MQHNKIKGLLMTIEELVKSLTNDVKSENYTLQAVFDKHITDIVNLKSEGITNRRVLVLLNKMITPSISIPHFDNIIHRAKQKSINSPTPISTVQKNDSEEPVEETEQVTSPNKAKSSSSDEDESDQLKETLEEWRLETNFLRLPERVAFRLERLGVTTKSFSTLKLKSMPAIKRYLQEQEFNLNKKYKDL